MIWINVNRVRIFVIPNYRMFAPKVFNFENIFALSIFDFFASKVFIFTFNCAMPRRVPICDILKPSDWVIYVTVDHYGLGNLWAWASDGSQWVHSNFFIRVLPGINTHFVTNIFTQEGVLPITVPLYIYVSDRLVSMHDELVSQPHITYHEMFRTYSCHHNEKCSILGAVGVCGLICHRYG